MPGKHDDTVAHLHRAGDEGRPYRRRQAVIATLDRPRRRHGPDAPDQAELPQHFLMRRDTANDRGIGAMARPPAERFGPCALAR